jgi:hypothetical protein
MAQPSSAGTVVQTLDGRLGAVYPGIWNGCPQSWGGWRESSRDRVARIEGGVRDQSGRLKVLYQIRVSLYGVYFHS